MIISRSLASPSTFVLLPQCSISHQALTQEATMPANRWTIRAEESCCHDEATGTCMTHVLFKIRDVTLPKSPRPGHNLTSQINFTHHLELVLIKSICGQKLGEKYEWTMTQNKAARWWWPPWRFVHAFHNGPFHNAANTANHSNCLHQNSSGRWK